jgi:hypothetical protein
MSELLQINLPTTTLWLLAAAAVVALSVGVLLIVLIARRPGPPRKQTHIGPADQRALERDITSLMHELSNMARQVGQQLDARSSRLQQLIAAADERIERLRDAAPAVQPEPVTVEREVSSEPDPRDVEIYALCDQGVATREIAQRLGRPSGEIELVIALRPGRNRRAVS